MYPERNATDAEKILLAGVIFWLRLCMLVLTSISNISSSIFVVTHSPICWWRCFYNSTMKNLFNSSSLVFKESIYSTQILLRTAFAAILIITLHTAALWSAQENSEFWRRWSYSKSCKWIHGFSYCRNGT
jgi:hypothetical protein